MTPSTELKNALKIASEHAKKWFEQRARCCSKEEFLEKGKLNDSGRGAVYAYFGAQGDALYVGLTKRRVKARLHDQTSPHKNKPWFQEMRSMKFIQLEDDMDRQILEFLLILAYAPKNNEKPRAVCLDELFSAYD